MKEFEDSIKKKKQTWFQKLTSKFKKINKDEPHTYGVFEPTSAYGQF